MSISRGVKLNLNIYLFFANLEFHLGTGAEKVWNLLEKCWRNLENIWAPMKLPN